MICEYFGEIPCCQVDQGRANMEQFEGYFQRADTDRDARISGAEAVAFFQGSNLSKQVLAQVCKYICLVCLKHILSLYDAVCV